MMWQHFCQAALAGDHYVSWLLIRQCVNFKLGIIMFTACHPHRHYQQLPRTLYSGSIVVLHQPHASLNFHFIDIPLWSQLQSSFFHHGENNISASRGFVSQTMPAPRLHPWWGHSLQTLTAPPWVAQPVAAQQYPLTFGTRGVQ